MQPSEEDVRAGEHHRRRAVLSGGFKAAQVELDLASDGLKRWQQRQVSLHRYLKGKAWLHVHVVGCKEWPHAESHDFCAAFRSALPDVEPLGFEFATRNVWDADPVPVGIVKPDGDDEPVFVPVGEACEDRDRIEGRGCNRVIASIVRLRLLDDCQVWLSDSGEHPHALGCEGDFTEAGGESAIRSSRHLIDGVIQDTPSVVKKLSDDKRRIVREPRGGWERVNAVLANAVLYLFKGDIETAGIRFLNGFHLRCDGLEMLMSPAELEPAGGKIGGLPLRGHLLPSEDRE
jgi:hypothetical protein